MLAWFSGRQQQDDGARYEVRWFPGCLKAICDDLDSAVALVVEKSIAALYRARVESEVMLFRRLPPGGLEPLRTPAFFGRGALVSPSRPRVAAATPAAG